MSAPTAVYKQAWCPCTKVFIIQDIEQVRMKSALLLLVLLSLVKVYCQQTFPYVSFMNQTLPNHSYVNINQVGASNYNTVQCRTDLNTCCSGAQGPHRGDWYFPNGDRLPFPHFNVPISESRAAQRVVIRRLNNVTEPTGIYCCNIAVHVSSMIETVCVGLYNSEEGKCMLCLQLHILYFCHEII